MCLAENARLDYDDVSSLLKLTRGDVRRCLLQLQLWVHSGRGSASQTEGFPKELVCPQRKRPYKNLLRKSMQKAPLVSLYLASEEPDFLIGL